MEVDGRSLMSEAKFYEGYSRYLADEQRYETWAESVSRVMQMHKKYYKEKLTPELLELIDFAGASYTNKEILGAQRALQFGGDQLLKNHAKMYNCAGTYCDRVQFFREFMWMLLSGAGVGASLQKQHVAKLPDIAPRTKNAKTFIVPDSIEGWSDAVHVLMSSFFVNGGSDESFQGRKIYFDLSKVRPKGAEISGGFKAPGPEPLRHALDRIELLIKHRIEAGATRLRPIDCYDIAMFLADAVLAGGVRRAATIILFSWDDEEMMNAKTGNWYDDNPQRGRSNNSVILKRDEVTKDQLEKIMESVKSFGEPGFIFVDDYGVVLNPCAEIGMYPVDIETGETGFQTCNLTEINGGLSNNRDTFLRQCKAAAILGTLQAGYTNFDYLSDASNKIISREALLGVGITGWMNNPQFLFDEENLAEGVEVIRETNKRVAELIGINQAARLTTVKPSGNASVLLGCASGIHGEHSKRYFRHVTMNKDQEVAKYIKEQMPFMVEDSVGSVHGTDYAIAFPVEEKNPDALFKSDLLGVTQMEYVKMAQEFWVKEGTNKELCVKPYLTHNVSNTITVDDWDQVTNYLYENRHHFAGVSFLAAGGDKAYVQAPFAEVLDRDEIIEQYGDMALLTSALIEVGLTAFNNNLWAACDKGMGIGEALEQNTQNVMKIDFVRRFKKFAKNFDSEQECANCLKDVYNFHKWWKITNSIREIDWTGLKEKEFVDIDTLGAIACNGGSCEITF